MTRPSLASIEPFSAAPWLFQPWGGQNQNGDYAESILIDAHGEALTYGLPNADGALIAAAPELLAAVRDVLALHVEATCSRGYPQAFCIDCDQAWPCPTVRRITAHLDLADPEGDPT